MEISVIVCTYNPDFDKLIETLNSCLLQKDVELQLVITDDGSKNNYFHELKSYFEKHSFTNYCLVEAPQNQGTVKNIIQGIEKCNYKYVKFISPGDKLMDESSLYSWLSFVKDNHLKWCFSDAMYYYDDDGMKFVKGEAKPQNVQIYVQKEWQKCRWYYLGLNDIAIGACIIGETELCHEYLKLIENKVKFAEDNIWRLMMFDGIVGGYFPQRTILYEMGTGISTNGSSVWSDRLKNDWNQTNEIMKSRHNGDDKLQDTILKLFEINQMNSKFLRIIRKPRKADFVIFNLQKKYHKRMTLCDKKGNS